MKIIRKDEPDETVGVFINKAFADYAANNDIKLNYEEYMITAENDEGEVIGSITGMAYYNEAHIGDLIIDKKYRGQKIGTKLVEAVEEEYRNKGFEKITLTTFGFQAPEFYEKLGYSLEFVREDKNPKLSKYFYCKKLSL
ncbi:MAG: GNAT family N-acetyltransferase [Lachnospiraceae bacterium]|nr:GNAT family N-acetyltransferase [Lachnospiraceae bacterium]